MAIVTITAKNFEAEVLQSGEPILVDFWADWCGPCRMLAPVIDEVAVALKGKARIGKVNVDQEPELAQKFSVMTIPTLILFQQGKVARTLVGVRPKAEILKLFEA